MAVKILSENTEVSSAVDVNLNADNDPIPNYLQRISQAIRSEQEAIREYQAILDEPSSPQNVKDAIKEVVNDEKDHMVILASLTASEISDVFPDSGDQEELTENNFSKFKAGDRIKYIRNTAGSKMGQKGTIKRICHNGLIQVEWDNGRKSNTLVGLDSIQKLNEASKLKRKKLRKSREAKNEALSVEHISTDETSNTTTYRVTADVKYDDDASLSAYTNIVDSIQVYNADPWNVDYEVSLVAFGAGMLKIDITSPLDVDVETAELIIQEILRECIGEGAVWTK